MSDSNFCYFFFGVYNDYVKALLSPQLLFKNFLRKGGGRQGLIREFGQNTNQLTIIKLDEGLFKVYFWFYRTSRDKSKNVWPRVNVVGG